MSINGNIAWTGISTPNSFNNLNIANALSVNKVNNFPHTVTVVGYTPVEFVGPVGSFFLMKAPNSTNPTLGDAKTAGAVMAPPKSILIGANIVKIGTDDVGGAASFNLGHSQTIANVQDIFGAVTTGNVNGGANIFGPDSNHVLGTGGTQGLGLSETTPDFVFITPNVDVTQGSVKVTLNYIIF